MATGTHSGPAAVVWVMALLAPTADLVAVGLAIAASAGEVLTADGAEDGEVEVGVDAVGVEEVGDGAVGDLAGVGA